MRVTSVFAVAVAMVASVLATPGAGLAQTCQRTVSIAPQVSAAEGAGRLLFAVHSGGCMAAGHVGYEVVGGSAQHGIDFHLARGLLQWAAGDDAVVAITATIVQDAKLEANLEDFRVQLSDPSTNVLLVSPYALGRILDDDGSSPRGAVDDDLCPGPLAIQACTCLAEVMPWRPMCVSVELHLSVPLPSPSPFRWSTRDGTARAGVDYVAVVDRSQILAAGQTTAALPVEVLSRSPGATSLYFYVRVTALSGGALVDEEAVFTIQGS